jgi:G3E family GTPase
LLHEHPRSQDVELQALLSGCLCCDLSGAFREKVEHLVRKAHGAPVFIETTGLAETSEVVTGVEQALKECTGKARLASVIVTIDAARFLTLDSPWSAAQDHLRCADIVVLNKLDEIDNRQANQVEQRVRSINPAARVARATQADVPIEWLLLEPRGRATLAINRGWYAGFDSGLPKRQF